MPDIAGHYDVAVLGGGITGLTLALQLKRTDPGLEVTVIERKHHPVPEAAHKVGESSVEVQAHYLRDVLGLEEHLTHDQLHKFGLRMFFSHGDNKDIARRVEYGQVEAAPLPSYQLDRGRLENHLGKLIAEHGVSFVHGKVLGAELAEDGSDHVVEVQDDDGVRRIAARWVVDATGRAGLLKRKLQLAKPVDHQANSVWFRIAHPVDVQGWSADEAWQERVCDGQRRLSTNHLMGPGYWVWLIPLASGSTSVGIVAEDSAHSFQDFNTLDRALDWLDANEPQVAADVRREQRQDPGLPGDEGLRVQLPAGVLGEPLVPDRRGRGLDRPPVLLGRRPDGDQQRADLRPGRPRPRGEEIEDIAAAIHNQVYLVLSDIWLVAYENQYPLMAQPAR